MRNYKYAIMHTGPGGTRYLVYGTSRLYYEPCWFYAANREEFIKCLSNNKTHKFLFDSKSEAKRMLRSIALETPYKIGRIKLSKSMMEMAVAENDIANTEKIHEKYELTDNTVDFDLKDRKVTVYQIRALKDIVSPIFVTVRKGTLGGWVENASILSQQGSCWISGNTTVIGKSTISGNARCHGCQIKDSDITNNAYLNGMRVRVRNSKISGNTRVVLVIGGAYTHINIDNSTIYGDISIETQGPSIEILRSNITGNLSISAGKFTDCTIGTKV